MDINFLFPQKAKTENYLKNTSENKNNENPDLKQYPPLSKLAKHSFKLTKLEITLVSHATSSFNKDKYICIFTENPHFPFKSLVLRNFDISVELKLKVAQNEPATAHYKPMTELFIPVTKF